MITITQNFNWSETARKLCIFIPNFGRGNYIRKLLGQFRTTLPSSDYLIIIGNDGIIENFEDLSDAGIKTLNIFRGTPVTYGSTIETLDRSPESRNGGFIRNLFIKNCQSEIIFQKDPETYLYNIYDNQPDWISTIANRVTNNLLYRPAFTQDLNQLDSEHLLDNLHKIHEFNHDIMKNESHVYYRYHWGYAIRAEILKKLRGYDEDFTHYGPEDRDLYYRLGHAGVEVMMDTSVRAMHFWHGAVYRLFDVKNLHGMESVASRKQYKDVVRNPEKWGKGY